MPLKIDLRAYEHLHVGNSTIVVASDERSTLIIDGTIPVMRQRDYVSEEDAVTPMLKLIRAVQSYYLSPNDGALAGIYSAYFSENYEQYPSAKEAMKSLAAGDAYKALRLLRSSLLSGDR